MSNETIEINGGKRRLVTPPKYSHVDNAGRVYIGTAYADKELLIYVTYPQAGDKEKFVIVGRPKQPAYDPYMEVKNLIASHLRNRVKKLSDAHFESTFIDSKLGDPTKGDNEFFKNVIEDLIESKVFQGGPDHVLWNTHSGNATLIDETTKEYLKDHQNELIGDKNRCKLLTKLAVKELISAIDRIEGITRIDGA